MLADRFESTMQTLAYVFILCLMFYLGWDFFEDDRVLFVLIVLYVVVVGICPAGTQTADAAPPRFELSCSFTGWCSPLHSVLPEKWQQKTATGTTTEPSSQGRDSSATIRLRRPRLA